MVRPVFIFAMIFLFFSFYAEAASVVDSELDLNPEYEGLSNSHKDLGVVFTKNYTSYSRDPQKSIAYRINNWGFRDDDFSEKKNSKKNRAIVFGSSYIFGLGISKSERWTEMLEESLPALEIFNMSMPGVSLDLIYNFFLTVFDRVESDYYFILVDGLLPLTQAYHVRPYSWLDQPKPFYNLEANRLIYYPKGEFPQPMTFKEVYNRPKLIRPLIEYLNSISRKYYDRNTLGLTETKSLLTAKLLILKFKKKCSKINAICVFMYRHLYAMKILQELKLKRISLFAPPLEEYFVNRFVFHHNKLGNQVAKRQNVVSQRLNLRPPTRNSSSEGVPGET